MDMDRARVLAIHERIAVRMKTRAVERARGPHDLNPMLFLTYDDRTHWWGKPIPHKMGEEFSLPRAIAADVFAHWVDKQRRIERIVAVMDAYVQKHDVEKPEDIDYPERGDLGRDFRNNPNTKVTEGMVTSVVWMADDGECHGLVVTQGYRFTEGGLLVWDKANEGDEMILDDENVDKYGQVLMAMAAAIQVIHQETKGY